MKSEMIKLGSIVKDSISGFTGTVTMRDVWPQQSDRLFVEPKEMHDGRPIKGKWFDEHRLELVEEKTTVVSKDSSATTGGPMCDPSTRRRGE